MPFVSKAQQGYLYANKPSVAKEFAKHTPKSDYKHMPEHKKTMMRIAERNKK